MYRNGEMDVMVNVDIFSEGFDCPDVEFIQLARPTLSLSKYLQQVGRGMRAVPHKDYVVILDQVGMYQTFGMPTEDRDWELMFRGKVSGKGRQEGERGYVIRDDGNDLKLVNLEMVRIKRHGEKHVGVEIFMKGGRYGVLNDGKYLLRKSTPYQRKPVSKWAIWYNRAILWMEDVLVVKKTGEVFPVKAYGCECFYVASHDEKRGRFIRVELNGDMAFADFLNIWQDVYEIPQWGSQKLIRASSGQMEYLDEEYKRKVKIVSL